MQAPAPTSGSILLICGLIIVVAAVLLVIISALQAMITLFSGRQTVAATGGGVDDWARLAEAVGKLPVWAVAMLAGDVQIWLGLKLLGTELFK
jgi:hypothetical protein